MDYDTTKADEVALALLYLNLMEDKYGFRAWKSISWEIMDSLHEKGYVGNPATKAKSVMVTRRARMPQRRCSGSTSQWTSRAPARHCRRGSEMKTVFVAEWSVRHLF